MNKKIELNVNEIKDVCKKHETDLDHFWVNVQKRFNFSVIQKAGDRQKRSGSPISLLFEIAVAKPVLLVATVQGFFTSQFSRIAHCKQWAFHLFFQDSAFNWRKVLYRFNKQIEKNEEKMEAKSCYPKALILDDSTLAKTGKKIEGVSRVHDHVNNTLSDWV